MIVILVGGIACTIMFIRIFLFLVLDEDKKSIQTWVVLVITLAIMVFSDSEAVMMLVPWLALIILAVVQHEPLKEKSMFEDIVPDDSWGEQYKTEIELTTVKPSSPKPKLVYQDGKQV